MYFLKFTLIAVFFGTIGFVIGLNSSVILIDSDDYFNLWMYRLISFCIVSMLSVFFTRNRFYKTVSFATTTVVFFIWGCSWLWIHS